MKNLFNSYKKSINPPYSGSDFFVLGGTFLVLLIAFVAVVSIPSNLEPQNSYTPPSQAAGQYLLSFNGDPSSPQPFEQTTYWNSLDLQLYESDPGHWYTLNDMNAQHGPDCSAPPNSHLMNQYKDSVYNCRNHIMTAMNAGYGSIILTPNALMDWTNGPAIFEYQMSTEQMSSRDWPDVLLSPFSENVATFYEVGFESFPKTGYQFNHLFQGTFTLMEIRNFVRNQISPNNYWRQFPILTY